MTPSLASYIPGTSDRQPRLSGRKDQAAPCRRAFRADRRLEQLRSMIQIKNK
jgi:hypothetical protein